MRKRISYFGIIVLIILFNIGLVNAYFFQIIPKCEGPVCLSNNNVTWNIILSNKGDHDLRIAKIEFVDSVYNKKFLEIDYDFDPLNSEKQDLLVITPSTNQTLKINSKIPLPNRKNILEYYPCFTLSSSPGSVPYTNKYLERFCYLNQSLNVTECITDNDCYVNQTCNNSTCKFLGCGECEHFSNHNCIKYECCNDYDCYNEQKCNNHFCDNFSCENGEAYINHSCVSLNCTIDEQIINHSCVLLNCSFDEGFINHDCVLLNCSFDEGFINHGCVLLNCSFDEGFINHSCVLLNCTINETIEDHDCKKITCAFFKRLDNGKCVYDFNFINIFLIELIIIIVIVLFFLLDLTKLRKKFEKK